MGAYRDGKALGLRVACIPTHAYAAARRRRILAPLER
jgi:hypothetical protein